MKFRLVCIIKKDSLDKGVDVEVCLETGSKTLSPFQRKVTIDDLLKSEEFASDTLQSPFCLARFLASFQK